MNAPIRGQHVIAIDLIRFIAAALVLVTHLGFDIQNRPDSPSYNLSGGTMPDALLPGLSFYGWIGVQIFFVISGIVITYSADGNSPYTFIRSRILRLVPAAWLCSTLTLLFLIWHQGSLTTELMRGYRHSMLFLPWAPWIDHVFWTLSVEIAFYVAVGLLIYKQQLEKICALAAYLAWICLAYWVLFSLGEAGFVSGPLALIGKLPYWADRVLTLLLVKHGCFFAAGIYICSVFINRLQRPAWHHIAAMLVACFLEIFWANVYANGPRDYPYWVGAALWTGSMSAILLGIRYNAVLRSSALLVRVLRLLGLMTYPLYLLHQNIGAVVIGRLRHWDVDPAAALGLTSLLVLVLCYGVVTYAEPVLKRWMGTMLDHGRARLQRQRA